MLPIPFIKIDNLFEISTFTIENTGFGNFYFYRIGNIKFLTIKINLDLVNLEIKSTSIFIPIIVPEEFHSKRYLSAMLLTTLTLKPIDFSFRNTDFYVRKLDYNNIEIINKKDFSGTTTEYNFIYY